MEKSSDNIFQLIQSINQVQQNLSEKISESNLKSQTSTSILEVKIDNLTKSISELVSNQQAMSTQMNAIADDNILMKSDIKMHSEEIKKNRDKVKELEIKANRVQAIFTFLIGSIVLFGTIVGILKSLNVI